MKIINLNSGHFFGLLNEANVLNLKDEFEGVSIVKYIEFYLQHLGSNDAKKMFSKKLGKLFVNDERFHHVVRQLPPNAPSWARDAARKKQLVYFKPDGDLDDAMEHLSHYVNAIEHDLKGDNPDNQAVAKRELTGFPKAENLDMLMSKSQDYFKRGSKKATRSEEGMTQIHDSGGGYRWYILQTSEAYKREGKALQNCIGQMYTRSSSRDSGYEMVVMRKGNDETVVAARINNKAHEIQEMKGKNNKPPVEKYMPYVMNFVNNGGGKNPLKLSSTAEHDFRRAGYFYIEGNMYTRPEAIKKYILKDSIARFPDGNELVQIKAGSQSDVVKELLRDLYPDMVGHRGEAPNIYELRNSNDLPLVSGAVENKKLEKLHRHPTLKESLLESVIKGKAAREFVGELIRRGYIDSVNDKMARDLFWNERIKINHKTGKFEPVKSEKDLEGDKNIHWEKHTDDDQVKMIQQSLQASGGYGGWGDDEKWKPMGIHTVYITKEKMTDTDHEDMEKEGKHFALVKTKDNILVPVEVNVAMDRVSTTDVGAGSGPGDEQVRRNRLIRSAVSIANQEDTKLTRSFAYNNGIVREKGKYKVFDPAPKKLEGDPAGLKIDLSKIPPGDRFNAINAVVTIGNVRSRDVPKDQKDHPDRLWDHDTEVQLKLDYALSDTKYARGQSLWSSATQEDADNWKGQDPDALYRKVFNGTPDTIFLVSVAYGAGGKKHQVFMLADGKIIVEIDGTTERHELQNWGDHDQVATQLNAFAEQHGLVFDKNAFGDKEELRVHNGKVATGAMIQKEKHSKLKKGEEGVDEVAFESGTQMVRMDSEEMAEWVRRGLDLQSLDGEAWKLIDSSGDHLGVVVVAKNKIQSIYGPDFDWDSDTQQMAPGKGLLDMTNRQSITPKLVKYVLGAKKQFKWKVKPSQQFIVKSNSDHHQILTQASNNNEVNENTYFHKMYDLGLIKAKEGSSGKKKISLTAAGRAVLKKLGTGKDVNALDVSGGAKIKSI